MNFIVFIYISMSLQFFNEVDSATSFLYKTGLNDFTFKNWVIRYQIKGEIFEKTQPHNFTNQIDLSLQNINISRYILYSPIVKLEPAWRISYKFVISHNNNPISCNNSCLSAGALYQLTNTTSPDVIPPLNYPASGTIRTENIIFNRNGQEFENKYGYFLLSIETDRARFLGIFHANISSFEVTYLNCPAIIEDLAEYPNVPAARDQIKIRSQGKCTSKAEPAPPYGDLIRLCDQNGETSFVGSCQCSKGYEQKGRACIECPADYFQEVASKQPCKKCGIQTDVVDQRTRCQCKQNYFRFLSHQRQSEKNCYSYPSVPSGLQSSISNNSVTFTWTRPNNLGSFNYIFYQVECQDPLYYGNCPMSLLKHDTSATIVDGLLSNTEYNFLVCSHNNVSYSNTYKIEFENCRKEKLKTKVGYPTKVENFRVIEQVGNLVSFGWSKPNSTGSDSIQYIINCNGGNTTVNNNLFKALQIVTNQDKIDCMITPQSIIGKGEPSFLSYTLEASHDDSDSSSNTSTIVGACIGGIVVLVIIASIIYFLFKRQKDKQKHIQRNLEMVLQSIDESAQNNDIQRLLQQRQRNIYVPLDIVLSQSLVDLDDDGPLYEDIPVEGYDYPYNKLEIIQKLGEGNFALVYLADAWDICGCSGKSTVAVKVLKDDCDEADKDDFEGELELMKELRKHNNVIQLLGICQKPNCMLVEYVPGGDLLSFLLKSRKYRQDTRRSSSAEGSFLSSEHMVNFAEQIARGMDHIASHNIVHRDLACRNVLVGYHMVCKIADLGLARKLNDEGIYKREKQAKLPVKWLPPESIKYARSSVKSDIWSFGVLLWEIVTVGGVPYPGYKSKDIPKLLLDGYRMAQPEHCSDELFSVMSSCWAENEEERPSFDQLVDVFNEMKDSVKTYINLDQYEDSGYLPLDDDVFADGDDLFMEGRI